MPPSNGDYCREIRRETPSWRTERHARIADATTLTGDRNESGLATAARWSPETPAKQTAVELSVDEQREGTIQSDIMWTHGKKELLNKTVNVEALI